MNAERLLEVDKTIENVNEKQELQFSSLVLNGRAADSE
jgi:hypothetical protein